MEIARRFGVKPGFSFDWFDTGRPDEIVIHLIPDRKELSRRLKGAGKSYSPLRDSVRELLQERSEEMVWQLYWTLPHCWHAIAMRRAQMACNLYLSMSIFEGVIEGHGVRPAAF